MSTANISNISEQLGLVVSNNPKDRTFDKNEKKFYYFLFLAFLMHASLLISITSHKPRRLGTPNGSDNAISVSLINTKDLESRATVDDQSAGAVSNTPPTSNKENTKTQNQQKSQTDETAKSINSDTRAEANTSENKNKFQNNEISELETSKDKFYTKKSKEIKPNQETVKRNEAAKKNTLANLDLSQPSLFTLPSGGGGAGVQRPPGITRSGENDDFARGVIRALQQTMPQLSDTLGRVTVRIILDKNGSLISTDVVVPSRVSGLDQNVVFATRQSSFPLPPLNANSADLTFFVTYIYR